MLKNDKIKNQMYKEILVELAINQTKPIPLIAREVRQSIKDRYAGIFTGKSLLEKVHRLAGLPDHLGRLALIYRKHSKRPNALQEAG